MTYFYEAIDANGQTVVGKIDALDVADVRAKVERLGQRLQSVAAHQPVGELEVERTSVLTAGVGGPSNAEATYAPPLYNSARSGLQDYASSGPEFTPSGSVSRRPVENGNVMAVAAPSSPQFEPMIGQAAPQFESRDGYGSNGPMTGLSYGQAASPVAAMAAPTNTNKPRLANAPARSNNIVMAGNAARLATQTATRTPARKTALTTTQTGLATSDDVSTLAGVSSRDLLHFFQQIASLTRSGMTIFSGLENLAARTPNRNLAFTIQEMAEKARTGGKISDVMARHPRIYPEHVVGLTRAGELGGYLDIALGEVADGYEKNIALYRWAWIPKMMATQAVFVVALAQPLFTSLFASMDFQANLALYFRLVLFRNLPIAALVFLLIKAGSHYVNLPQNRAKRDAWALRVPPFGDLQRQAALTKFIGTLGRLYRAGVAPIQAWEGAMYTASNVAIRERLAQSYEMMNQGASLPEAFTATGLFTNSVENIVLTGHQSGQVVEMLDQAGVYYQEQTEQATTKSRFMMLRLGFLALIILGGGAVIWMAHTYFAGMFHFVDANFGDGS